MTQAINNNQSPVLVPAQFSSGEMLSGALSLRAQVYGLASVITGNTPTFELLAAIRDSKGCTLLAEELPAVARILQGVDECIGADETMRGLAEEYQRLYIGPAALPAPLWESVYRDPEHILFGDVTLQVRNFYGAYGLASTKMNNQPEDHIAVELEFMHSIIVRSIDLLDALERNEFLALCEAQAIFLKEHLLEWAPQPFALQLRHAETNFYAGAAQLITNFIPYDFELLNEITQGVTHACNS